MSAAKKTASLGAPSTPLAMAEWAIDAGLWPVAIHPYDAKGPSPGKRPIGDRWGAERPDLDSIRATFKRHPKAGVGLKLGAEGGVIDIDVDQPEAARETLARMFPGEAPDTLKWQNAPGRIHALFRYDARLAAIVKTIVKGVVKPGGEITGNPAYVGLEVRIGAGPGGAKQIQTVVPPSCMANGAARRWLAWGNLLTLPEHVVEDLLTNGRQPEPAKSPGPGPRARPEPVDGRWTPEARAVAYLQKCEPAVSGQLGHDKAFKAACKVGPGFDLSPDTLLRLLVEVWNPTCDPPWSAAELRHKVEEAYKVEPRRGFMFDGDRAASSAHVGPKRKARPDPGPAGPKIHDPGEDQAPPEPPAADPDVRPAIEVSTERHEVAAAALEALRSDPDLYARAGALVDVVQEPEDRVRLSARTTITKTAGSPKVIALSDAIVGCRLTAAASFYQWRKDKNGEEFVAPAHPPDWLIRSVSTRKYWPGIRRLDAVAECPFPRPDGSIVEARGYDEATATLFLPSIDFPAIPAAPTQEDAKNAWIRISDYVKEFPFASDDDRIVYLAGILTIIARPAIPGPVPGIAVIGNKASTGKGLLIDVMTIPGTGRSCPTSAYPYDNDEAVKVKVSIAKACKVAVHFDNLDEGSLYGSGPLDSALTSTVVEDRQLGANDMPPLNLRSAWFLSGNNVYPCKDAYRRWLVCNLQTDLDKPEERSNLARPDLRGDMIRDRPAIVRDALTILRAHSLAGRPEPKWSGFGSFEDWSLVVRAAVWFASGRDCLTTQRQAAAESPERAEKMALLEGLLELDDAHEGKPGITSIEAYNAGSGYPDKYPTLHAVLVARGRGGKLMDSRQLGNVLKGMLNTPIGCYKLAKNPELRHKAVAWIVKKIAPFKGESGETGESTYNPHAGDSDSDSDPTMISGKGDAYEGPGETDSPVSPDSPLSAHWEEIQRQRDLDPMSGYD